ncbi:MAG: hypothetical protein ACXQTR_02465 [Candidatus Methanospirareceae archaeon]
MEKDDIIEVNGIKYKLKKPGEYRIVKAYGNENKDVADIMRDLIVICVEEPKLTTEEVEDLDGFLHLGLKVLEFVERNFRGLEEDAYLKKRTAQLLKEKSKKN